MVNRFNDFNIQKYQNDTKQLPALGKIDIGLETLKHCTIALRKKNITHVEVVVLCREITTNLSHQLASTFSYYGRSIVNTALYFCTKV